MRRRQAVHVELELDEPSLVDVVDRIAEEVATGTSVAGIVNSDDEDLDLLLQDRRDLVDAWAGFPLRL